jgi:predicted RNA-binding protein YlqC (UPF0109 family)
MDDVLANLKQSVERLVFALVDDPSTVEVGTTEGHSLVVFEIRCPQREMGKIVGKHGRNIQALRTIMSAIGAKYRKRVQVEVIEPTPE